MNKGIIQVDKSAIDTNRATNRSAVVTFASSIGLLIVSIKDGHFSLEILFMAVNGFLGAFAQWLQGSPSRDTRLIKQVLGVEGDTNYEVIRNAIDRLVRGGSDPVRDVRPSVLQGDDGGRGRGRVTPPSQESIAIRQWREENERSFKAMADDDDDPITQ